MYHNNFEYRFVSNVCLLMTILCKVHPKYMKSCILNTTNTF